jgi:hypothetical protein
MRTWATSFVRQLMIDPPTPLPPQAANAPLLGPEQQAMLVRLAVASGPGVAITTWLLAHNATTDQINALQVILIMAFNLAGPAIAGVWGWFIHSISGRIASVEAIKGVTSIGISPNASPELQGMVDDKSRPKVIATAVAAPVLEQRKP